MAELDLSRAGGGAVVVVDQHLSWADLFQPGWGAEVEFDLVVGSSRDSVFGPEASFRYGAFAALALDHFEGDIVRDGAGAGMEVDDLDLGTLILGGKVVTSLGDGSRVDGRIGLGVDLSAGAVFTFDVDFGIELGF